MTEPPEIKPGELTKGKTELLRSSKPVEIEWRFQRAYELDRAIRKALALSIRDALDNTAQPFNEKQIEAIKAVLTRLTEERFLDATEEGDLLNLMDAAGLEMVPPFEETLVGKMVESGELPQTELLNPSETTRIPAEKPGSVCERCGISYNIGAHGPGFCIER